MKAALLVLVLLVQTVQCQFPHYGASGLKYLNSVRAYLADKQQIANMNKVEYNSDLENVIYSQLLLTGNCPDQKLIYLESNGIPIEVYLKTNVGLDEMDLEFANKFSGGAGKTQMGHVVTRCMVTGYEVKSYAFFTTKDQDLHGAPGSKCPSGRKTTINGLCALEKS
ncbi:hypothetical protein B9Z55_026745 [Caenorhabditis nigoni]|uniref:SCP domain-containing protein n=1 Tax=Caenorhabditis nigoni TaxID=1611254 RepID=A0A2G5SHR5_9PELO|nr:hypothetical protein B9Z55_026745 [Caenorhabditis nigoni]